MIRKLLFYVAAAAALATAAGALVVSLAYALFAYARDYVGPAGAAAVVAGAVVLVFLILGLILLAKAGMRRKPPEPVSLTEKLTEFVKDKPLAAAAAAVVGGFLAFRNPLALAAILKMFAEPKSPRRR